MSKIFYFCVFASPMPYTQMDVASLVKATSKLSWSVAVTPLNVVYVAVHTYESAHFMNWPNFCPCFACSHLLAISQTEQKSPASWYGHYIQLSNLWFGQHSFWVVIDKVLWDNSMMWFYMIFCWQCCSVCTAEGNSFSQFLVVTVLWVEESLYCSHSGQHLSVSLLWN
jgi:hypothetical protein